LRQDLAQIGREQLPFQGLSVASSWLVCGISSVILLKPELLRLLDLNHLRVVHDNLNDTKLQRIDRLLDEPHPFGENRFRIGFGHICRAWSGESKTNPTMSIKIVEIKGISDLLAAFNSRADRSCWFQERLQRDLSRVTIQSAEP
jgi:hypothetical protein